MRLFGLLIRRSQRTSAVLLTVAVISASAPSAFALHMQPLHEKKHDAKRQVEALEEQWRQAQLSGDVVTMDSLLSDDYIGITLVPNKPYVFRRRCQCAEHLFPIHLIFSAAKLNQTDTRRQK